MESQRDWAGVGRGSRSCFGATIRAAIALGSVTFAAAPALAHDFFVVPQRSAVAAGEDVSLRATVGSSFPSEDNSVTADRIDRLIAQGAGSPRLEAGTAGPKSLPLRLTGVRLGDLVAAIKTKDRDVEYGEDRIPLILEEYRVSAAALAAVERLAKPRTLKVVSRRFAKTLLCVQRCGDRAVAGRPLGASLEFVAAGSGVDHFRLLSLGRPLADYPVDVVTQDGKRRHLSTDRRGELHMPPDARGPLMLFAAVMTPPQAAQDRFTLDLTTLTLTRP